VDSCLSLKQNKKQKEKLPPPTAESFVKVKNNPYLNTDG
jgi:hypothetical protein